MRNRFLELHGRIDESLAVLATTSDGNRRSKALHDMKTALDELDEMLGLKTQTAEHAEDQSPADHLPAERFSSDTVLSPCTRPQ